MSQKQNIKHAEILIVKRLNAMKGVFCPNPGGAFYAMAKLPIDDVINFANGCWKILITISKQ